MWYVDYFEEGVVVVGVYQQVEVGYQVFYFLVFEEVGVVRELIGNLVVLEFQFYQFGLVVVMVEDGEFVVWLFGVQVQGEDFYGDVFGFGVFVVVVDYLDWIVVVYFVL